MHEPTSVPMRQAQCSRLRSPRKAELSFRFETKGANWREPASLGSNVHLARPKSERTSSNPGSRRQIDEPVPNSRALANRYRDALGVLPQVLKSDLVCIRNWPSKRLALE
jgi:hypothetical protein